MPQLWHANPAFPVNLGGDIPPSLVGIFAVEPAEHRIVARRGVIDVGAIGDHQAGAALGAAGVVFGRIVARYTAFADFKAHRGENEAVRQGELAELERSKQPREFFLRHKSSPLEVISQLTSVSRSDAEANYPKHI